MSKSNNTAGSNVGTYGDDVLNAASLPAQRATVSVQLAHMHGDRFAKLLPLVRADNVTSVRDLLLNDWGSTPQAEEFMKRYDALQKIKDKTAAQADQFKTMQGVKTSVALTLTRAIDTYEGIALLRDLGRTVTIRRLKGIADANVYQCNVVFINEALAEDDREDSPVPFVAAELMRVKAVHTAKPIADDVDTTTLKSLCSASGASAAKTGKAGAANADKAPGNGVAIDASNMGSAIASLDTAISTHLKDDGRTIVGSKATNEAMHLLWAKLDSIMTEAQKAKARKAYADEAAKSDAVEAAKAEAAKQIKAEADKAAAKITAKVKAA